MNVQHFILGLVILNCSFSYAQLKKYKFPTNPEVGKCYQICLQYDKKIEWEETDCNQVKKQNVIKETDSSTIVNNTSKLRLYQITLSELGYNVTISGCLDDKTVDAHNSYLRKKERENRKQQRQAKRKLRKAKS